MCLCGAPKSEWYLVIGAVTNSVSVAVERVCERRAVSPTVTYTTTAGAKQNGRGFLAPLDCRRR